MSAVIKQESIGDWQNYECLFVLSSIHVLMTQKIVRGFLSSIFTNTHKAKYLRHTRYYGFRYQNFG